MAKGRRKNCAPGNIRVWRTPDGTLQLDPLGKHDLPDPEAPMLLLPKRVAENLRDALLTLYPLEPAPPGSGVPS